MWQVMLRTVERRSYWPPATHFPRCSVLRSCHPRRDSHAEERLSTTPTTVFPLPRDWNSKDTLHANSVRATLVCRIRSVVAFWLRNACVRQLTRPRRPPASLPSAMASITLGPVIGKVRPRLSTHTLMECIFSSVFRRVLCPLYCPFALRVTFRYSSISATHAQIPCFKLVLVDPDTSPS